MTPAPRTAARRRLTREQRRRQIVEAAIALFAEQGFDASTRLLAERLGITQPLIYSYFPSKEDLVEAVYEAVFVSRWDPAWEAVLADRDVPLRHRLERFYNGYATLIHSTDWMRLYLQAGLRTLAINRRYTPIVEKLVIERICIELRHAFELPCVEQRPITGEEMEAVWMLHGGIFYYGVRKYVYRVSVGTDYPSTVRNGITTLLEGMPVLVARLLDDTLDDTSPATDEP